MMASWPRYRVMEVENGAVTCSRIPFSTPFFFSETEIEETCVRTSCFGVEWSAEMFQTLPEVLPSIDL